MEPDNRKQSIMSESDEGKETLDPLPQTEKRKPGRPRTRPVKVSSRPWGRGKPLAPDQLKTDYENNEEAIKRYLKKNVRQFSVSLPSNIVREFSAACRFLGITQVSVIKPLMLETIKKAEQLETPLDKSEIRNNIKE